MFFFVLRDFSQPATVDGGGQVAQGGRALAGSGYLGIRGPFGLCPCPHPSRNSYPVKGPQHSGWDGGHHVPETAEQGVSLGFPGQIRDQRHTSQTKSPGSPATRPWSWLWDPVRVLSSRVSPDEREFIRARDCPPDPRRTAEPPACSPLAMGHNPDTHPKPISQGGRRGARLGQFWKMKK